MPVRGAAGEEQQAEEEHGKSGAGGQRHFFLDFQIGFHTFRAGPEPYRLQDDMISAQVVPSPVSLYAAPACPYALQRSRIPARYVDNTGGNVENPVEKWNFRRTGRRRENGLARGTAICYNTMTAGIPLENWPVSC